MKSTKLYRADNPYWLTDASIRDNGDLVVMSGDTKNEWSKIVPAGHKPALLNVLLERVTIDEVPAEETDDRLLRALSAMFAGENAYEDIGAFLERHAIPSRDSNWLWAED